MISLAGKMVIPVILPLYVTPHRPRGAIYLARKAYKVVPSFSRSKKVIEK